MTKDEILECAKLAHDYRYGSIVLQAGERNDPDFVGFIEDIVRQIKQMSNNGLALHSPSENKALKHTIAGLKQEPTAT